MQNSSKKYIIFGAGRYGEEALLYYGIKNVAFFCDNNKAGSMIKGVEVISFTKLQQIYQDYRVVLAVANAGYKAEMQKQLESLGIEYEYFFTLNSVLTKNNFEGEYKFINRSKDKEKLLIVLAGYKDYLWDGVFSRLEKYVPKDTDVCIMTAGYESEALEEICEKHDWSYLCTVENKLSLTQNITIKVHPAAKWIYKIDEDIFVTPGLFEELFDTYQYVIDEKKHTVGCVVPIMAINSYGYRRVLELTNSIDEYEQKYGSAIYGRGPVFSNSDVAEYMWEKTLPLNSFAERVSRSEQKYSICYHRYSIGCILIPRAIWEDLGGFQIAPEGVLGVDEEHFCMWCMNKSYAIVVAERAYAGHFAFGPQTERMKSLYSMNPERWQ